jgi:hypothetical protein
MITYAKKKNSNTCGDYLDDAITQGVKALLAKGEERKEAGIKALFSLGGFLLCKAITQEKAPQNTCSCSSK